MKMLKPIPHEEVTLDPRRAFTPHQRAKLFERAGGKCDICGDKINGTWIAGHYPVAHNQGGRTVLENGRVECMGCAKGTHVKDTGDAWKTKRLRGESGQRARRKRNGPQIVSRGFDKRYRKKMNGEVVKVEDCLNEG